MGCSKFGVFMTVSVIGIVTAAIVVGVFEGLIDKSDSSKSKGPRAVESLKFLIIITRNGNRCPLVDLPNDPYPCENSSYWPYNDDLSIAGRKHLYNLGVKLRHLYDGFLSSQFFNKDVYVTSTFMERAKRSAKCLLAGLYFPSGSQVWNDSLLWQPVPIHEEFLDKTQLKNLCKRFVTLESEQQTEFRDRWATNISYYNNYTSNNLNGTVSGSIGVLSVWDALMSDKVEGFNLPEWAASIFPDPMYPMMNDMYVKYVSASDEMTRLTVGPLFVVMMDVLASKVNGSLVPDRALYYWSGHEDTLIALQAIVGVPTEDIVGVVTPGSAMLLELHYNSTTQRHFIEVLYIDGLDTSLEPVLLHLPYCNSTPACDYHVFVENTLKFTNVTAENYNQVCSSS